MQRTFYYRFKKVDAVFVLLMLELAFVLLMGLSYFALWFAILLTALVWGYKNIIKHPAVVITDKDIKVDYSNPLVWKDIASAEIKTVRLCGKDKKILSLNPKTDIQYHYSYLQKNNADFGPFPIPLYGILSPEDEKEIIHLVGEKVKIKK